MAQQALAGQELLIVEVSQSHSDTPHLVGLLWTSDQSDSDKTHNTYNRQISMPPEGFEPTIPAVKRPQANALDRTASEIGVKLPVVAGINSVSRYRIHKISAPIRPQCSSMSRGWGI